MPRIMLLQYDRPVSFQIINNGLGCRPSCRRYPLRKVLSFVYMLIGIGNNCTNKFTSHSSLSIVKRATFRGWILGRWFDMEGYYYNFTYNCKWGTINEHFTKHTRSDNSGKCLARSCCRRSCWWRFTSVYCQVRKKTFDEIF